MKRTYSTIPPHLSLVPVSTARQAALAAIAEVEDRQKNGRSLATQPWSRAFFRHLAGSGRATQRSLMMAGVHRSAKDRISSISEYEHAFNILLQSNGLHCPLPLPDSVRHTLFPEFSFAVRKRVTRRENQRWRAAYRQEAARQIRKAALLQAVIDQAGVELTFCSPETLGAWYERWEDELQDEWPSGAVSALIRRFPSLRKLRERESSADLFFIVTKVAAIVEQTPSWLRELENGFSRPWIEHHRLAAAGRGWTDGQSRY